MTTETKNETDTLDDKRPRNILEMTQAAQNLWESLQGRLDDQYSKEEERQQELRAQRNAVLNSCKDEYASLLSNFRETNAQLAADLKSVQKVAQDTIERNKELSAQNEILANQKSDLTSRLNRLRMEYEKILADTCSDDLALYKTGKRERDLFSKLPPTKWEEEEELDKRLKEKDDEIKRLKKELKKAHREPVNLANDLVEYAVDRLLDIKKTPDLQGFMKEKYLIDLLISDVFCKYLSDEDAIPIKLSFFDITTARSKAEMERQEEHTLVQHNDHCQQVFAPVNKPTFNNNKTPDQ